MPREPIPTFYLYGEPRRAVDGRFLHVEALDDRSRPGGWTIRPHAHAGLAQVMHMTGGGGTFGADGAALPFRAPAVLLIPPGVAHGLTLEPESAGTVMTLATAQVDEMARRDPDLARVLATAAVVPLQPHADAEIGRIAGRLMRELSWAAPGHRAAAEAGVLALMVVLLRLIGPGTAGRAPPGRAAGVVARLRERIEARFRLREPVEAHAAALGLSPGRLRAACAAVARQSPSEMLDQRAMLEARRMLVYTPLGVAEIGYALGFADAAYFTRFFTRHEGVSPGAFRKARE